ncbi:MarR family transcriptional regulator [Paractinoplanes durhamensis]|uniref:MarR family transcriptional regulator n=1 Tax=Paractinoplanes durhamensis TaxID=113563 RepID=A0ABQ3Z0R5_9ACTN|nr:MarR family transcriptional regulator [Actinoplanes durhamensis]GIE03418.1 hypothetical protein Adu01nite_47680 [Actinoplanes durhamensis]
MTDEPCAPPPANSAFAVLAAIADLGAATPAAIAKKVGIGYSTVNPKLRAWEDAGLAERFQHNSQTLWRLTDAGNASTATRRPHDATLSPDPGTVVPPAVATPSGTPAADDSDLQTPMSPALAPDTAAPPESAEATEPEPVAVPANPSSARDTTDAPVQSPTAAAQRPGAGDPDAEPASSGRRLRGSLREAVLTVLKANPSRGYTVTELRKLIDRGKEDGAKAASAGAVANAAHKLVELGQAVLLTERPATFGLAPAA